MFDFAWSEIVVIGVVALVVIGPKDLPKVLRTVGTWVGKARAIAREFQGSLDQMMREAELEEVRKSVETATSGSLEQTIERAIDPAGELKRSFSEPPIAEHGTAPTEPSPPAGPATAAPPAPTLPAPEVAEATPKSATGA
jgi:sec-independent protein translocase protein TatB